MKAIVTVPPYAPFIEEVAKHPIVSGIRLNTVMPTTGKLEDTLKEIQDKSNGKDIWIDLKSRQLRVEGYWVPPFTEIQVSHPIEVNTPVTAYFNDGETQATVLKVDKNKLIMQEGPQRVIGPGESLNIIDPSLRIHGFLTDTDKQYIEASQNLGIDNYMLSFVESQTDINAFKSFVPNSNLAAKIESQKGLNYVQSSYKKNKHDKTRLMNARGDLFVEVEKPHHILRASYNLIKADPNTIAASRIFPSLAQSTNPSNADISDADSLMRMGYKTFMFGDEICLRRESIVSGLNLLTEMAIQYSIIK